MFACWCCCCAGSVGCETSCKPCSLFKGVTFGMVRPCKRQYWEKNKNGVVSEARSCGCCSARACMTMLKCAPTTHQNRLQNNTLQHNKCALHTLPGWHVEKLPPHETQHATRACAPSTPMHCIIGPSRNIIRKYALPSPCLLCCLPCCPSTVHSECPNAPSLSQRLPGPRWPGRKAIHRHDCQQVNSCAAHHGEAHARSNGMATWHGLVAACMTFQMSFPL